jgi:hypothetical protein
MGPMQTNVREAVAYRPTGEWLLYFQGNVQSAKDMPWEWPVEFTEEQKRLLIPSIRAFQKGEGSEGHNLHRFAREYSQAKNDPAYVKSIEYFIREEQKHSEFLRLFLGRLDVKPIDKTWTDSVFRSLRTYAGLEVSITVLLAAEMMATVYYPALHRATSCELLKKICERIYADEAIHVQFQSERLRILRATRSWIGRAVTSALEHFLFFGTVLVVWLAYGSAMRAGGFSFLRYWFTIWRHFYQIRSGVPLGGLVEVGGAES